MAWNLFRWLRWLARPQRPHGKKRKFPRSARPRQVQPDFEQLEIRWMPAALSGITEYAVPTASSGPKQITSGPDGLLWFTESSASKIAKVTTAGTFTQSTSTPATPTSYARAPTRPPPTCTNAPTPKKTPRSTPPAATPKSTLPAGSAGPHDNPATAGADGSLWFTAIAPGKIFKAATDGT